MVGRSRAKQGEIWLARLDPILGSEIQKTRPCLIVSPDVMNQHLGTVTVMPLTSGSRQAPFRVAVQHDGRDGLLLADQIRTLAVVRLVKKLGVVDADTLTAALAVLREMFS